MKEAGERFARLGTIAEIMRAVPTKNQAKIESVRYDSLVYRVDPPRHFPGVGRAQLVHVHFKCTVVCEGREELVYIDRDRLVAQK